MTSNRCCEWGGSGRGGSADGKGDGTYTRQNGQGTDPGLSEETSPRMNEPAHQLPVQVYNSHGEIVPSPSSPQADLTA